MRTRLLCPALCVSGLTSDAGAHDDNYLVQNVSRALVSKMVVKFAGSILQDTDGYDLFKIYEDLFLSQEQRGDMILEGIQSEDLCKIRSNSGDKKTSDVDTENTLTENYKSKYVIRLDHGHRFGPGEAEIQADEHPARV